MNLKQRALTNNGAEGVPKVTKCFIDFASAKNLDFECKYLGRRPHGEVYQPREHQDF